MRRSLAWLLVPSLVVAVIGLTVTGCGGPLTLSYVPVDIASLPGLGSLATYAFVDRRETEERRIGTSFFYGQTYRRANPVYVREPVAVAVTRAFADGLRARGFRIVDMTAVSLRPGPLRVDAPVAVSGEVTRFWTESVATSGLGGSLSSRAECAILLRVHETATGTQVWDKIYWEAGDGPNEALARTVKAALNDPELIEHLNQP